MKRAAESSIAGPHSRPALAAHPVALLAAIGAAVFVGLKARGLALALEPAGSIYLFLLEMTVIPILISAMVSGIAELLGTRGFGRLLVRIMASFLAVALFVGVVGAAVGFVAAPGSRLGMENQAKLAAVVSSSPQGSDLTLSLSDPSVSHRHTTIPELVMRIVPRNVFSSLAGGRILPIALFSFFLGLAIGLLREKQQGLLLRVAEGTLRAFTTINGWLIYLLPIGIICLLAPQIGSLSGSIVLPMLRFVELFGMAAAVCLLAAVVLVWARSGQGLLAALGALVEPAAYAFITGNSLISLPYALGALSDRLRFRRESTQFVQPVMSVAGSFGNMLFFILATIFISQFYGSYLTPGAYGTILLSAMIAAVGTTRRSGAATIALLPLVLTPLGLPVDAALVIFGALGVIVRPVLSVVDVSAAMGAAAMAMRRPAQPGELSATAETALAAPAQKRRISIRAALVVLVGVLVVLTGGVMLGLLYSGEKQSIYVLADGMVKEISAQVEQRTLNYFTPAERSSRRMQYLLESGLVAASNRSQLLGALRDEVENNPEFASAYFADPAGNFFMIKRMPDGSLSSRVITRSSGGVAVQWKHANPAYATSFPDSIDSLQSGYDPRTRGWYKAAAESPGLVWTDVYLFASDNMLGISNAARVCSAGGKLVGVVAVDIGLAELSYFLGSLDVSRSGKVFILNNKSQIVALSTEQGGDLAALFSGPRAQGAVAPANLVVADESSDAVVRQSYRQYLRSSTKRAFFAFQADGERYLSMYTAFPRNRYFDWTVAIAIPEGQIMSQVNRTNTIVLYAALLIIVVGIGIGVNFSRAITFPLGRLSREMDRIRNFDLLGDEPVESGIREINSMTQSFLNMKQGLRAFNKYVPSKLVAQLLELGLEPKLGGQSRDLTILFSDIQSFTSISEKLEPHQLIDQMAIYFTKLSNIIMENGGTVDKYIGDAIMAFWNAPVELPRHAEAACRSALAMQRVLHELHAAHRGEEVSVFGTATRLGLHTGQAVVGNMGSSERLNYTVIGDSVNLASRLEGLNKYYGTEIIASESTVGAAGERLVARLLDRVAVKGRTAGIDIYELVGWADSVAPEELAFVRAANEAVRRYLAGKFEECMGLMPRALALRPSDQSLQIISQRCAQFARERPAEGWNGVFVHHEK